MEIYKNTVRFDIRLYLKSKKYIPKHRRIMLIEHLIDSVEADGMFPNDLNKHDNFFEPNNEYEKKLWESCRELAKKDMTYLTKCSVAGQKSAETRKQKKEEKAVQKPELELPPIKIKITEEEFLNWAKQMNDMAGVGGFKNTETQAAMFWNHFSSQGWRKKNGMPITDPKSAYKLWVIKDKKDEGEDKDKNKMSDKPMTYEEMIAQTKE